MSLIYYISRQGKMYKIQVTSKEGEVLPPVVIRRQLEQVSQLAGGDNVNNVPVTHQQSLQTHWTRQGSLPSPLRAAQSGQRLGKDSNKIQ